jgi:hypothetical protein
MRRQPLFQELPLPVGERYLIHARGDVVPERLDVSDLLVDRELVETRRGEGQRGTHHARV